jgi:serine protease Do
VEHTARVLGASQCSDLALIQIDGNESYPYLDWYRDQIKPGLDIYAAGFPLGDPEFTLSRGIVSRAHGVIDEYWASVDASIEHDANINPGSSGGPVVTSNAQVVGIDYADNSRTRQSFAISRDEALRVLPQLRGGQDVTSIGINGFATDSTDEPGIWVSSVDPGSVAAAAGILPGDVLTQLDGVDLAQHGTMSEFCDVLRSHAPSDELPFTVDRSDDEASLDGTLNGAPIEPGFAFVRELGHGTSSGPGEIAYQPWQDSTDRVTFEVPATWTDVVNRPWKIGGQAIGRGMLAAPDTDAFLSGWDAPGVFVGVADAPEEHSTDEVLADARLRFERSCTLDGRHEFSRGGWAGEYELWTGCGGGDAQFVTLAASTEADTELVGIQTLAASDDDLAALDHVLVTLEVVPSGP